MLELTGPMWNREGSASAEALAALRKRFPALPADYFALLGESNGGEGELGVEPGWFQLWPAEEVASNNNEYEVARVLPGFIAFGGNGGGELLAFTPQLGICSIPAIVVSEEDALPVATDIREFVSAMGRRIEE
jgi:hypothetical protein